MFYAVSCPKAELLRDNLVKYFLVVEEVLILCDRRLIFLDILASIPLLCRVLRMSLGVTAFPGRVIVILIMLCF